MINIQATITQAKIEPIPNPLDNDLRFRVETGDSYVYVWCNDYPSIEALRDACTEWLDKQQKDAAICQN